MKNRCLLAGVAALFLLILSPPAFAQKFDLKLMTGPMGGSWYPLGGAIADAVQKEIPGVTMAVMPGGGVANVEALEFGKCEIGFSNSSSAVDGLNGRSPFKKKMEEYETAGQSISPVLPDDRRGQFQDQIRRRSEREDPPSTEKAIPALILTEQVLQVYGLSFKDMSKVNYVSYSDSVSMMKDGHADISTPGNDHSRLLHHRSSGGPKNSSSGAPR